MILWEKYGENMEIHEHDQYVKTSEFNSSNKAYECRENGKKQSFWHEN